MFFYITAEDVFGSDTPRRAPRPPHPTPDTLCGLYDLGLRHHVRPAVLSCWTDGVQTSFPDWKFDRLAIRLALFGRERLGLEPGQRALVMGPLGWLWPALDFATTGFGVVPVGLEHDASDDAIAAIVAESAPRAAFATDARSAERLVRLRKAGRLGDATVVGEGLSEEDGLVPAARLMDLAAVLDTPERAQAFRAHSRRIAADSVALWHVGPQRVVRLTHREAMAAVAPLLQADEPSEGDVGYIDAPRVTLRKRLAMAALVGDGATTITLGREGGGAAEVVALRPHKLLASESWLGAACEGRGPRWPAALHRAWARRRVAESLGGRLRWVESGSSLAYDTARTLAAAGVRFDLFGAQDSGQTSVS